MEQKYCVSCDEPVVEKKPPCPLMCKSPKCAAYQDRCKINTEITPIIWVLGGPGSGKETQCKRIVAQYGYTHLSTGDLLRNEINSGSDRGKCLTSIMARGGLVPNDLVLAVLKEAMINLAPTSQGFLVDGYPREKSQGAEFEKVIAPATALLFFEASHATLIKRLLYRAQTSNRPDDNEETIKLRLKTFDENNDLVLDQYKDKLIRINAEPHPDAIFNSVKEALDPIAQQSQAARAARTAAQQNAF
ncbi:adenylate kinase isoenzyme 1-like [Trichoplusia ni]|uniref:Adenylate kinase isoenzyme 1-like n=1 Tax=Trichoplusia ni TaxID=7111 RepID=A0A7E5WBA6_TRINI|nr:adenylate kinase isoenzyme 1-like [Trichoplusia ni]